MAQKGKRNPNEIIAGARLFQKRAEEHEQEDIAGGHPDGYAKHALRGQPVV